VKNQWKLTESLDTVKLLCGDEITLTTEDGDIVGIPYNVKEDFTVSTHRVFTFHLQQTKEGSVLKEAGNDLLVAYSEPSDEEHGYGVALLWAQPQRENARAEEIFGKMFGD
jgi:hypothetical protein